MPRGKFHRWTPQEDAKLKHLRDDLKLEWDLIAERFRLTDCAVIHRYQTISGTEEERRRRRQQKVEKGRAYRQRQQEHPLTAIAAEPVPRIEQTNKLRPRDLTGEIFGDPPVGRSALDQKQGTYVG